MTGEQNVERIHDEHGHLREVIARVEQVLAARESSGDELVTMFRELAERVLDHFQHEESGGYFREAIEIAPRLSERASELLTQHPAMADDLADLQRCVRKKQMNERWWRELREQFSAFAERFRSHETAEIALIQEAYNDDIGAED